MPYGQQDTKRLDLGDIGIPGYFVELRDPRWMTEDDYDACVAGTEGDESSTAPLRYIIKDWNLIDPKTDEPLPLPSDDPKSLRRVPSIIMGHIGEQVKELQAAPFSPTPKANSS